MHNVWLQDHTLLGISQLADGNTLPVIDGYEFSATGARIPPSLFKLIRDPEFRAYANKTKVFTSQRRKADFYHEKVVAEVAMENCAHNGKSCALSVAVRSGRIIHTLDELLNMVHYTTRKMQPCTYADTSAVRRTAGSLQA